MVCMSGRHRTTPVSVRSVRHTSRYISPTVMETCVDQRAWEMPQIAMILKPIQSDDSGNWGANREWLGTVRWFTFADIRVVG
jgi:hypothetical protein